MIVKQKDNLFDSGSNSNDIQPGESVENVDNTYMEINVPEPAELKREVQAAAKPRKSKISSLVDLQCGEVDRSLTLGGFASVSGEGLFFDTLDKNLGIFLTPVTEAGVDAGETIRVDYYTQVMPFEVIFCCPEFEDVGAVKFRIRLSDGESAGKPLTLELNHPLRITPACSKERSAGI